MGPVNYHTFKGMAGSINGGEIIVPKGRHKNRIKLISGDTDNQYAIAGLDITNSKYNVINIIKKIILSHWFVEVELNSQKLLLNKKSLCSRLHLSKNDLNPKTMGSLTKSQQLGKLILEKCLEKIDNDLTSLIQQALPILERVATNPLEVDGHKIPLNSIQVGDYCIWSSYSDGRPVIKFQDVNDRQNSTGQHKQYEIKVSTNDSQQFAPQDSEKNLLRKLLQGVISYSLPIPQTSNATSGVGSAGPTLNSADASSTFRDESGEKLVSVYLPELQGATWTFEDQNVIIANSQNKDPLDTANIKLQMLQGFDFDLMRSKKETTSGVTYLTFTMDKGGLQINLKIGNDQKISMTRENYTKLIACARGVKQKRSNMNNLTLFYGLDHFPWRRFGH